MLIGNGMLTRWNTKSKLRQAGRRTDRRFAGSLVFGEANRPPPVQSTVEGNVRYSSVVHSLFPNQSVTLVPEEARGRTQPAQIEMTPQRH